ncbi:MAG TPA: cell division protein ZapE [Rhodanobacteraceae bacterium]|nr:cell division protein ZapE [Rhodanobacteraceae bacterium]
MDGTLPAVAALAPGARYARDVAAGRWQDDPAQRAVLAVLDRLYGELVAPAPTWYARLRQRFAKPAPPRGLYLWGEVGRGKTLLMDEFVATLPAGVALRVHFHRFMLDVNARLRELGEVRDPLPRVAAQLAAQARVLCLDEFMVADIGDAMLLSGLLASLFERGVALVTTSNTPPRDLYKDGLQRARFLPAIALLERYCEVHELASPHDWRLRALTRAPVYLTPADAHAQTQLEQLFASLARGRVESDVDVMLDGRSFHVRRKCPEVVWFDFAALCEVPSGSADFIELAHTWPTVLVSGVPQFTPLREDAAQRFVHLIDELYDRRVKLALSAQAPAVELYDGTRLRMAFARTASRLIEMQTREYLALAHRPYAGE